MRFTPCLMLLLCAPLAYAQAPAAAPKPPAKTAAPKPEAEKPAPAAPKLEAPAPEGKGGKAPARVKKAKKPFTTLKLTPSDKEVAEAKLSLSGQEPMPALVQAQRGGTFLLDLNGVLTNENKKIARKERINIIPKKQKGVDVVIESAGQSYPGMAFRRKKGFYQLDINNILTPKGSYRYRYNPHTIGLSLLFGGDSLNSTKSGLNTYATGMFTVDFYTENRYKRRNGYSPLVQFRVGYGMMPFYAQPSVGLLFGGSQYVFDKRGYESGIGWSMLVNGGMSFDLSPNLLNNYFKYPGAIGAEIEFKAIYNFHKYVGLSFGFLMGYSLNFDLTALFGSAASPSMDTDPDGYPVYKPGSTFTRPGLVLNNNFRWAFTLGLVF